MRRKTKEEIQELERFETLYKLPILKGTSRQVPWGRDIRYRHLQYLDMIIDGFIKDHNLSTDKKPQLLECFCSVAYDDDASFWINNKNIDDFEFYVHIMDFDVL